MSTGTHQRLVGEKWIVCKMKGDAETLCWSKSGCVLQGTRRGSLCRRYRVCGQLVAGDVGQVLQHLQVLGRYLVAHHGHVEQRSRPKLGHAVLFVGDASTRGNDALALLIQRRCIRAWFVRLSTTTSHGTYHTAVGTSPPEPRVPF